VIELLVLFAIVGIIIRYVQQRTDNDDSQPFW